LCFRSSSGYVRRHSCPDSPENAAILPLVDNSRLRSSRRRLLVFLAALFLIVTAAILIPVLTAGSPGSPTAKTLANDRELAAVAARTLQHNLVIYSQSRRGNETTWLTTLMLFDHDGDFAMYFLPATKKRAANGSVPSGRHGITTR